VDFGLSPEQAEYLEDFRAYLDEWSQEGLLPRNLLHDIDHDEREEILKLRRELIRRLGDDGWLRARWPVEYGGEGRSHVEHALVMSELQYRRLPHAMVGVLILGHCLMRAGSEEQKARYLPGIISGDMEFALGYSEPNAGTDLASLQTRAVRAGDVYVVTGQKIWTSFAHTATHLWLATRTGAPDSRHKGLTVFIADLSLPGITIRPIETQADFRVSEIFFDQVRVPAIDRVGDENDGWRIITMALDFERTFGYGALVREFEEVVAWTCERDEFGCAVIDDPAVRNTLAELMVDAEVARLFAMRTSTLMDEGQSPSNEASMNKVWNTELRMRLAAQALDLIGEAGQLRVGEPGAPIDGRAELAYRLSPVFRFAAGTNEVQRNIVAQRGLGLPRR
jgi:hypothetical protein